MKNKYDDQFDTRSEKNHWQSFKLHTHIYGYE